MKKNVIVLIGVFVLLAVVAVFLMNRPGERSVASSGGDLFVSVDSSAVDIIEFTSPSGKVTLEKKGVEWFLKEPVVYRADQQAAASIIHEIKNLEVTSTVSSNPEKRSIFRVDSTGTLVKLYQNGEPKVSFVVGKMGQSYNETYARKEESNDVVVLADALTWAVNKPSKDWRDKTLLNIPKESITGISFQYPGESFALTRNDSMWFIGNAGAKASEVSSLLGSLSNLQTDNFVDTMATQSPRISATIGIGDEQLRFYEIKDAYLVQTSNSPQWFEIQGWKAKQILKHKKDLI